MEVWKDVKEHEGRYQVSSYGRVYNKGKEKFVTEHDNGAGYQTVSIYFPSLKKSKTFYVHRLVAQHFLTNGGGLPQVGHKDDNKANNRAENLYWCTPRTNIRDAHETGRMKKRSSHGTTIRVPYTDVRDAYIEAVYDGGGITKTAEKYGMPRTTLSSIINKRSNRDITDEIDKFYSDAA